MSCTVTLRCSSVRCLLTLSSGLLICAAGVAALPWDVLLLLQIDVEGSRFPIRSWSHCPSCAACWRASGTGRRGPAPSRRWVAIAAAMAQFVPLVLNVCVQGRGCHPVALARPAMLGTYQCLQGIHAHITKWLTAAPTLTPLRPSGRVWRAAQAQLCGAGPGQQQRQIVAYHFRGARLHRRCRVAHR